MNNKPTRGGARKGAGRPRTDTMRWSLRIPSPLARRLAAINRTAIIRALEKLVGDDPKQP